MCCLRKSLFGQSGPKEKVPFRYTVKDVFAEKSNIEIVSNTSAVVEGSQGVLEYSEKLIRIALKDFSVAFIGRKLNLKCISATSLVVEGFFTNIEFSV